MIERAKAFFSNLRYQNVSRESPDPPGVTIPLSLVRSAQLASWMAYFALVYFLFLYTLDIARDRAGALHLTHVGGWVGELQFYFPYIIGFTVVAIGIPYVAKIAIPVFMSLRWRPDGWAKAWALFIALAVSLVVIAGTFTVQGDTLLERDRESAVAVAEVEQSNAVLQAQITAKEAELRSMMENRNAYLAQAASVGEAEWQRSYIEQTNASDPQRERIVRALGAARSADRLRGEIQRLREQAATGVVAQSVASRVTTSRTSWIADTLSWLEGARAMLLSLVMDVVCLIMPWIALRLEQARARQLAAAGIDPVADEETPKPAPLPLPPPDGRNPLEDAARDAAYAVFTEGGTADEAAAAAQEAIAAGPQNVAQDKDTGEKKIWVGGYWRAPTRGPKKDETGIAQDGGSRTALTPEQIAAMAGNVLAGAEQGASLAPQAHADTHEPNANGDAEAEREEEHGAVHTPDSTPASPEQEAPSEEDLLAWMPDEPEEFEERTLADNAGTVRVRKEEPALEGAK